MNSSKPSRIRRSIEKRDAKVEVLNSAIDDPELTKGIIGKITKGALMLERHRERPRDYERRLADRVEESRARNRALRQQSHEEVVAALGRLHRVRHGEPVDIPPSEEVRDFAHEEELRLREGQSKPEDESKPGPQTN